MQLQNVKFPDSYVVPPGGTLFTNALVSIAIYKSSLMFCLVLKSFWLKCEFILDTVEHMQSVYWSLDHQHRDAGAHRVSASNNLTYSNHRFTSLPAQCPSSASNHTAIW